MRYSSFQAGIYRHYKGPLYQALFLAHDANDAARVAVIYVPLQLDGAHEGPRPAIRTYDDFYGYVQPEFKLEMGLREWKTQAPIKQAACEEMGYIPRFLYLGPVFEKSMLQAMSQSGDDQPAI